jgi:hypothetical protein
MSTKAKLHTLVARVLIAATTSTSLPPQANAGVIGTDSAVMTDRDRISLLIDHPDICAQLEAHGVKPSDAKARVAALTDAEVAELSAGIDHARAGAGGGGGALVFAVFVILLAPLVLAALLVTGVVQGVKLASRASESAKSGTSVAR